LRRGLRRGFGSENAGGFQSNRGMLPQSDLQNLQTEIDTIQSRAESMQRSLDAINERLTEMEKGK
jgi:peptidoglycan hydrolase CwlO-like protein